MQDGPDRPLQRDDARLRALHRSRAGHAGPVPRGRRAGGVAGPRRDRPAPVAAATRVRPRQPVPPRRALSHVLAHGAHPADRAGARAGLRVQPRHRDRVLLRPARRAGPARALEPARHARQALLRRRGHARVDRLPGRDGRLHERARVGRSLVRPRGRQRPVRVRLQLHRRDRDGRPLHALPDDGQGGRPLARLRGHLHAEALERPHRRRGALQHVARRGGRRARTCSRPARARIATAAGSPSSGTGSWPASSPTRRRSWRSPARR